MKLEYKIGDCLELMKEYPDNYFDLVLTDPPYGIGESNEKRQTRLRNHRFKADLNTNWHSSRKAAEVIDYGHYEWDDKPIIKEYFDEMKRISRDQIIFGGNYYLEHLGSTPCFIVWDKDNGNNDFADCELAWTSFNTAVRKFKYRWNGMLQEDMANKEKRVHPTQKPVALFKWILENYSKKDDLICDPFLGSGTTLRACRETGRNCIGFEKEPKYESIIRKRAMLDIPDLTSFCKVEEVDV